MVKVFEGRGHRNRLYIHEKSFLEGTKDVAARFIEPAVK